MNTKVEPLTDEGVVMFMKLLLKQRADITGNGKTIRIDFNTSKDDTFDESDLASADVDQGMQMRLGNRESLYFKKIEEALLRIREGSYGNCTTCGGAIGQKRLEARPTAELCIDCKETAERAEALNAEGRRHKSLGEVINFRT